MTKTIFMRMVQSTSCLFLLIPTVILKMTPKSRFNCQKKFRWKFHRGTFENRTCDQNPMGHWFESKSKITILDPGLNINSHSAVRDGFIKIFNCFFFESVATLSLFISIGSSFMLFAYTHNTRSQISTV